LKTIVSGATAVFKYCEKKLNCSPTPDHKLGRRTTNRANFLLIITTHGWFLLKETKNLTLMWNITQRRMRIIVQKVTNCTFGSDFSSLPKKSTYIFGELLKKSYMSDRKKNLSSLVASLVIK